MRLPSWGEFVEKEKIWEKHIQQKINEKISDAVKDRPVLDMVFSASLTLLPPPLGTIAQNIYDNAKGSSDDPISEVVKYFEKLEEAGREHYEIVANKLDSALIGIQDLKVIDCPCKYRYGSLRDSLVISNSPKYPKRESFQFRSEQSFFMASVT
jgi:hypothetical protein